MKTFKEKKCSLLHELHCIQIYFNLFYPEICRALYDIVKYYLLSEVLLQVLISNGGFGSMSIF